VRPVNLLPAKHRPRSGGAEGSKASYVSLGVLGGLVVAVLLYVLSANQVSSNNAEIAKVQQEVQAAEMQAVTLQSYGNFAGTKEARIEAVKSLATARLDWERLFRELAHVLPSGVWLTSFDGMASGGSDGEATGTGSDVATGPTAQLDGCADSHSGVADVMVRLRELHGVQDVELAESAKPEKTGASAAGTTASSTAAAGSEGCGRYTSFKIDVTLEPAAPSTAVGGGSAPVPARLGGGE
jgi:Tfp pilus assembly protein PilN